MPGPREMVRAAESIAGVCTAKSAGSSCWELSAMRLEQWRVPSVLKLECLPTKSCTLATEFAVATFSVLYSMLPAQLESFSGEASEESSKGMATVAVQSLINVRFFMDGNYRGRGKEYNGNVSDSHRWTRCRCSHRKSGVWPPHSKWAGVV